MGKPRPAGGGCPEHCSWTRVLPTGRQPGSALHGHQAAHPRRAGCTEMLRQGPREQRHNCQQMQGVAAISLGELLGCLPKAWEWGGEEGKAESGPERRTSSRGRWRVSLLRLGARAILLCVFPRENLFSGPLSRKHRPLHSEYHRLCCYFSLPGGGRTIPCNSFQSVFLCDQRDPMDCDVWEWGCHVRTGGWLSPTHAHSLPS